MLILVAITYREVHMRFRHSSVRAYVRADDVWGPIHRQVCCLYYGLHWLRWPIYQTGMHQPALREVCKLQHLWHASVRGNPPLTIICTCTLLLTATPALLT
jgi:hypothetical protein